MGIKRGWFNESYRHSLAAKGISSGGSRSYMKSITGRMFELSDMQRRRRAASGDVSGARKLTSDAATSELKSKIADEKVKERIQKSKEEMEVAQGKVSQETRMRLEAKEFSEIADVLGAPPEAIRAAVGASGSPQRFVIDLDVPSSDAERLAKGRKLYELYTQSRGKRADLLRLSIEKITPELYEERFKSKPRSKSQVIDEERKKVITALPDITVPKAKVKNPLTERQRKSILEGPGEAVDRLTKRVEVRALKKKLKADREAGVGSDLIGSVEEQRYLDMLAKRGTENASILTDQYMTATRSGKLNILKGAARIAKDRKGLMR